MEYKHEIRLAIGHKDYELLKSAICEAMQLSPLAACDMPVYDSLYFCRTEPIDNVTLPNRRLRLRTITHVNEKQFTLEEKHIIGNMVALDKTVLSQGDADMLKSDKIISPFSTHSCLLATLTASLNGGELAPRFIVRHTREQYESDSVKLIFEHDIRIGLFKSESGLAPLSQGIIFKIVYGDFIPKGITDIITNKSSKSRAS